MRIVRTRDESGAIVTVNETSPNVGNLVVGDLYGDCSTSDVVVPIRERLTPIRPSLIIGIAQNYSDHRKEMSGKESPYPSFFIKMPHAVIGSGATINLPNIAGSTKVDYEAELAVVLKKTCSNISEEEAWDHVLGITAANDVTARDWQKEWGGGQFNRGKGFDTFCPLGPCLLTMDEWDKKKPLIVEGFLNGEKVQRASTDELIFSIPKLIQFLSQNTTLPSGTVILTGTPSGVGHAQKPPKYLKSGDEFCVKIDPIGSLKNRVS